MKRKLEQSFSENRKTRRQRHDTLKMLDVIYSLLAFPDDISGLIAEYAHNPNFGLQKYRDLKKGPSLTFADATNNFPNELLEECVFYMNIKDDNRIKCLHRLIATLFSVVYLKKERFELDAMIVMRHFTCCHSFDFDLFRYICLLFIELCKIKQGSRKLFREYWLPRLIDFGSPLGSYGELTFVNQFLGNLFKRIPITQEYTCPFH